MNTVSRECLKVLNAQTRVYTDQRLLSCYVLTDNGYIEGKELDDFFRHMMKRLGPQVSQHTCDS